MTTTRLHVKAWLYLSFPPLLLAVASMWGALFRQTELDELGFNSELYPLSVQELYIKALAISLGFLGRIADWLNRATADTVLTLDGAVLLVMIAIWFVAKLSTKRSVIMPIKRYFVRQTMGESGALSSVATQRAVRWISMAVLTGFGFPLFLFASMAVALFLIAPPLNSAKTEAAEALKFHRYQKWPIISWVGEGGHTNSGFLKTCSERWCAVFQGDHAVDVPFTLVKRIDRAGKLPLMGPPPE